MVLEYSKNGSVIKRKWSNLNFESDFLFPHRSDHLRSLKSVLAYVVPYV